MVFSVNVRDEAFTRCRGRCECRKPLHAHKSGRCHHGVTRHTAFYHAISDQGQADLAGNCRVLCAHCQPHER
jgi:hypothetical protein